MKALLAGLLLAIGCTGMAHAQQEAQVQGPIKLVASETVVEKREVRTVRRSGTVHHARVRCRDGSVHRNVRGACRRHGGFRRYL